MGLKFLEARYVSEDLDMTGPVTDTRTGSLITNAFGRFFIQNPPAARPVSAEEDDSYLAPQLVLRYRPSDDQTYYGSIARGVKPGGLSPLAGPEGFNPDVARFEAEEITVYEFGWKTSWMDNRLRLNGALFYQDFSEKQLTPQYVPPSGIVSTRPENASAASIIGLELDTTAVLTDNLTMSVGYTLLSIEYEEYNKLSGSIVDVIRGGVHG